MEVIQSICLAIKISKMEQLLKMQMYTTINIVLSLIPIIQFIGIIILYKLNNLG